MFTPYTPQRNEETHPYKISGLPLAESYILSLAARKVCNYELHHSLLKYERLCSSQRDAIALCCEQHGSIEGGVRCGFCLADGAGCGKTRTLCGVLLEVLLRGPCSCLFVTVNSQLIHLAKQEFHRMLKDITGSLSLANNVKFCTYRGLPNLRVHWESSFSGVVS